MEKLTGKQLGPYQIMEPLGEGGMAAVYKAYQPSVERIVALKVLSRPSAGEQDFFRRFRREAKTIAGLSHPNILPIHDFGEADGYAYIVMPYIEGGTINGLLKGIPLPLRRINLIVAQIAAALDYAHSKGVIHRDVKPGNVLLDKLGNCLLSDFGIARIVEATAQLTAPGVFLGTPIYASPEQALGKEVDGRSDIYSLGVMLYEMATGRPPFHADTPMAILIQHIHDPLPMPRTINPAISETTEQVILKALAKEPEQRYLSAGEMANALAGQAGRPFQTADDLARDLAMAAAGGAKEDALSGDPLALPGKKPVGSTPLPPTPLPDSAGQPPEPPGLHEANPPKSEPEPIPERRPTTLSVEKAMHWGWIAGAGLLALCLLVAIAGGGYALIAYWNSGHTPGIPAGSTATRSLSPNVHPAAETAAPQKTPFQPPTDTITSTAYPTHTLEPTSLPSPADGNAQIVGYDLPLAEAWTLVYNDAALWVVYRSRIVKLELVEPEDRFRSVEQIVFPNVINLTWDESRSLYWAVAGTPWSYNDKPFLRIDRAGKTLLSFNNSQIGFGDSFASYPTSLAWDGQYLWVTSGDGLFKLQPVDGSDQIKVVDSYANGKDALGLAWDGNNLWVLSNHFLSKLDPTARPICQIDLSVKTQPDLLGGVVSDWHGLAWDGEFLWLLGAKLYRIDPSACQ
jgi:serine/threonine protein kinase